MKVEYKTYEYEWEKGMGKEDINFWFRQDDFLLASVNLIVMASPTARQSTTVNPTKRDIQRAQLQHYLP